MSIATASLSLSAADHERAMSEYGRRAEARAHALGNRGPIRLGPGGFRPEPQPCPATKGFRPVGPDDDPEFLAELDRRLRDERDRGTDW